MSLFETKDVLIHLVFVYKKIRKEWMRWKNIYFNWSKQYPYKNIYELVAFLFIYVNCNLVKITTALNFKNSMKNIKQRGQKYAFFII